MKLITFVAAVTLAQAAKLDRVYLPPNARNSAGSANFLTTPNSFSNRVSAENYKTYSGSSASNQNAYEQRTYAGFDARPERAQAALERNAAILRQDNSNDGETYSFVYETENGIYAEESGVATNGVQAQGGYTYTGDDGKVYSVRYTADENGFIPQGDHLPTSPPIPEEILKALEQNARDEAAGIYDDGSYNEAKFSGNSLQQGYNENAQSNNYNGNAQLNNYNKNAQSNNYNVDAQFNNYNGNTQLNNYNKNAQSNNYNRNTQSNNYNRNTQFNNYNRNTAAIQKTYLPPSAQRNNSQRNGY